MPWRTPLNDEEKRKITILAREGHSYQEIGDIVGCTRQTIARWVPADVQEARRRSPMTTGEQAEATRRFHAGHPTKAIARALRRSRDTINALRKQIMPASRPPRSRLTDEERATIRRYIEAGPHFTDTRIAAIVGRSAVTVGRIRRERSGGQS